MMGFFSKGTGKTGIGYSTNLREDLETYADHCLDAYGIEMLASEAPASTVTAAIHQFISEHVGYQPRNKVIDPVKAWENGGDCSDYAVLVGSMLASLNYAFRILTVGPLGETHSVVEFGLSADDNLSRDEYRYSVRNFYEELGVSVDAIRSDSTWRKFTFFPIDPTFPNYIGDIDQYVEHGYVKRTGPAWDWVDGCGAEFDLYYDGSTLYRGDKI